MQAGALSVAHSLRGTQKDRSHLAEPHKEGRAQPGPLGIGYKVGGSF